MTKTLLKFFQRPEKLEYAVRHFSATWKPSAVFQRLSELEKDGRVRWNEADRTFVVVEPGE